MYQIIWIAAPLIMPSLDMKLIIINIVELGLDFNQTANVVTKYLTVTWFDILLNSFGS